LLERKVCDFALKTDLQGCEQNGYQPVPFSQRLSLFLVRQLTEHNMLTFQN
jgi:hypothetical protein